MYSINDIIDKESTEKLEGLSNILCFYGNSKKQVLSNALNNKPAVLLSFYEKFLNYPFKLINGDFCKFIIIKK